MYLLKKCKTKKAEEELTRKINSSSILDEAVKEINIPILKTVPARKSIPFSSTILAVFQNKSTNSQTG